MYNSGVCIIIFCAQFILLRLFSRCGDHNNYDDDDDDDVILFAVDIVVVWQAVQREFRIRILVAPPFRRANRGNDK